MKVEDCSLNCLSHLARVEVMDFMNECSEAIRVLVSLYHHSSRGQKMEGKRSFCSCIAINAQSKYVHFTEKMLNHTTFSRLIGGK